MSAFSAKPTLVGERATLRPFRLDDVGAMAEAIADPDVRRLTGTPGVSFDIEQLRSIHARSGSTRRRASRWRGSSGMRSRSTGDGSTRSSWRSWLLTSLLAAGLLAGCSWHEKICGSEEYPAKAVGNTTGRTCVQKGQNPPPGYVRYPAGKEPKYVGDKWDKYWSTVVVDEHGNIVAK